MGPEMLPSASYMHLHKYIIPSLTHYQGVQGIESKTNLKAS